MGWSTSTQVRHWIWQLEQLVELCCEEMILSAASSVRTWRQLHSWALAAPFVRAHQSANRSAHVYGGMSCQSGGLLDWKRFLINASPTELCFPEKIQLRCHPPVNIISSWTLMVASPNSPETAVVHFFCHLITFVVAPVFLCDSSLLCLVFKTRDSQLCSYLVAFADYQACQEKTYY